MAELVGVDGRFLDGDAGRGRRGGVWWEDVAGRVGVWVGGRMPVVLVDERRTTSVVKELRTRADEVLRHVPRSWRVEDVSKAERTHLDVDGLEEGLVEMMAMGVDLHDALGDLIYERWVDYVLSTEARQTRQDWAGVLHALEKNAETTRRRNGSTLRSSITYTHWTDLTTRTALRHLLDSSAATSSPSSTPDHEEPPGKTANERSLDRVTYLGGLLLPMTVVSSILAIEGPYGPTGSSFWVFWLASGISSLVAVMVIYVDQVRRVDVWFEMDDGVVDAEGARGRREMEEEKKRWRRGELGWKGAVKRVSGMERWWPSEGVRFQRPVVFERVVIDV
ncbi:hypothetical protein NLU13_5206 [Sarocladium strictum]|uniref:Uncharacterized protein n=1 Tax=Sarocladium strictum TaxID=5046 RepID=A0AA39GHQ8_SARSR|nr:hypothetical protein NLU13_5206 [Sarocladium strictum]